MELASMPRPGTPWTLALAADPRAQLAIGASGLLISAAALHRDRVGLREVRAFRLVNELPDGLYPAVWPVMQLGNFAAAPVTAAAACLANDPRLALRLLAAGSATWTLAKAVKRVVSRPRPAMLLDGLRRRGREQTGLGYVSGHAGVAVALATAALPNLPPSGRLTALAGATTVGLARIYVGAHLPLDVVGGASLGVAVNAALGLLGRPLG